MTEYLRLLNTIRGGNDGLPPRRKKINIMIEIETGVRMLAWQDNLTHWFDMHYSNHSLMCKY